LRRDRRLEQTAAVPLPGVVVKRSRSGGRCAGALRWLGAGERAMNAIGVAIVSALSQLPRQVDRVPKAYAIEILAPDRLDQPLDKRMRDRSVRNRLDFLDLDDAQFGEPAVESKQRVVVGTDVLSKQVGICNFQV